ncbi:MAG: dihydroorotate dehydrogenase [Candidatus Omnitrophota bacterium]
MENQLKVKIGKLSLKNSLTVASGTFGYGEEFIDFIDLKKLGAIVTKTITLNPRPGNPMPRTCETPAGMLNSIGLENPGIEVFIKEKIPRFEKFAIPIIASISSEKNPDEFLELTRQLNKIHAVSAIELNISCPNIKSPQKKTKTMGYRLISQDPKATYEIVKAVRKITNKTLITKLSPNVTDITEIARAAECAGSDAVALVNTFYGMSIDVFNKTPKIAAVTGGLSGPAIRPIALRMVWEVYKKIKIPIIGMGGIVDTTSALEFFIAGASAISVGTANFINPKITLEIIAGLTKYLNRNKVKNISEIRGALKV